MSHKPESAITFALRLNTRGLEYEQAAADFLRDEGYAVQFEYTHNILDSDLTVAPDIPVEVKGSSLRRLRHNKRGYGFLLHKVGRSRRIHEPVTILVCRDGDRQIDYFFLIPTPILETLAYVEFRNEIPHQSTHRLTHYYRALDVLDAAGAHRQMEETCKS